MTYKLSLIGLIAAALIVAPINPASADPFYHHDHHDGLFVGLVGVGAAVTVAAATLVTAPVRIIADVAAPPRPVVGYYGPVAYAYPPAVYPVYGHPYRRVVYGYGQPGYGYRSAAYIVR
jgi:hypothetical protein